MQLAAPFEIFCQQRVPSAVFDSMERHPIPKYRWNTRIDIKLTQVEQWFGGNNDRPICWLRGPTGSGKSVIAQAIAERYYQDEQLAASYFFDRRNTGHRNSIGFVPTIASQLASSVPSARTLMERALQNDLFFADKRPRYQFKRLIVDPLLGIRKLVSPKIVVIDAPDQCDREWVDEIFALLITTCQHDQFPLRFCITGQAEDYLDALFEEDSIKCKIYALSLDEFDVRDDLVSKTLASTLQYPSLPEVVIRHPAAINTGLDTVKSQKLDVLSEFNDGSGTIAQLDIHKPDEKVRDTT